MRAGLAIVWANVNAVFAQQNGFRTEWTKALAIQSLPISFTGDRLPPTRKLAGEQSNVGNAEVVAVER